MAGDDSDSLLVRALLAMATGGALSTGVWRAMRPGLYSRLSDEEMAAIEREIQMNRRAREQKAAPAQRTREMEEARWQAWDRCATYHRMVDDGLASWELHNDQSKERMSERLVIAAPDGSVATIFPEADRISESAAVWARAIAEAVLSGEEGGQQFRDKLGGEIEEWAVESAGLSPDSWSDFDSLWRDRFCLCDEMALQAAERWYRENKVSPEVLRFLTGESDWSALTDDDKRNLARLHVAEDNSYWRWWAEQGSEQGKRGVNVSYDPYRWVTRWRHALR